MKLLLIPILLLSGLCHGQGVFSNKANQAIREVLVDFPNRFYNIRGDTLAGNDGLREYTSKIFISQDQQAIITENSTSVAWVCLLFETSDFHEAEKQFEFFYKQIVNSVVQARSDKACILNARYRQPLQRDNSTVIVFQLLPANRELNEAKIELSITNIQTAWIIQLSISGNKKPL